MLLLLLNYLVLRALWKIDVHLISTLVNKSLYYLYNVLNIVHALISNGLNRLLVFILCGLHTYRILIWVGRYIECFNSFPVLISRVLIAFRRSLYRVF